MQCWFAPYLNLLELWAIDIYVPFIIQYFSTWFLLYLCLYLVFNSLTLYIFLISLILLCLCSVLEYMDQIKHLLALPCNFYSSFINTVSFL